VSGLANGTAHTFTVRAANSYGTGPPSAPSAPSAPVTPQAPAAPGLPQSTVPGPPRAPRARAGLRQARVSWDAPASGGGAPITRYEVRALRGNRSCTWTGGPLSCRITGLANTRAFRFVVRAHNAVGIGPDSVRSAPVRPFARLRTGPPRRAGTTVIVPLVLPGSGRSSVVGRARLGANRQAIACRGRLNLPRSRPGRRRTVRCTLTPAARRALARGPLGVRLTATHLTRAGALFQGTRALRVPRG
jgi:hypothetical protein